MADSPIPTDLYSSTRRALEDNPGAHGVGSTVRTQDFYGNSETWVIETYRTEDGKETILLEHNSSAGGTRHVLPPQVAATLVNQHDRLTAGSRKRAARRAVETRRLRGDKLGNPGALAKARKAGRR